MAFLPAVEVNVIEKGNELVAKAKKSVNIKSGQERRRDDLRKKIVVIGITDQSPGIYYSSSGL
jgi:ribosomal protein L7Ae-like RNA K-turn-binding protein